MYNTFTKYFHEDSDSSKPVTSYTFNNYDVKAFVSRRDKSHNRNVLGRIYNNLVHAINEHTSLPKLVVMVLDDDIIKDVHHRGSGTTIKIGMLLNWLVNECGKAMQEYKNYLPAKAKRSNMGQFLWICPPTHKYFGEVSNDRRTRFTDCLQRIVSIHSNMSCLKMLKIWDHDNSNLFIYESYRFTSEGLVKYWLSIDSAIWYWVTAIANKANKKSKSINKNLKKGNRKSNSRNWK